MPKSCLLLLPTGNATRKSFPSPFEVASPGVNPSKASRQNPLAVRWHSQPYFAQINSVAFHHWPPKLIEKTWQPKSSRRVLVVARCSTQLTFADFHNMKPLKQRSFIGGGMQQDTCGDSIMSKKKWSFLEVMTQKIKITTQPIVGPLKHQVVTIFWMEKKSSNLAGKSGVSTDFWAFTSKNCRKKWHEFGVPTKQPKKEAIFWYVNFDWTSTQQK